MICRNRRIYFLLVFCCFFFNVWGTNNDNIDNNSKNKFSELKKKISVVSSKITESQNLHTEAHTRQFAKKLAKGVADMHIKQRLKDVISQNSTHLTPVVLFHGLNEDGSSLTVLSRWIRYALPGIYVHILGLGDRYDSFFTNMNRQVAACCEVLARNERLAHGFNVIGFSQGALTARGYIERCNSPKVFTYISFAGPQMGVFQVPAIHDEQSDFILQGAAYEEWSQEYLAPAQYFRHPMKPRLFSSESVFLADLNNERPIKNSTYKKNIESLQNMVLVKFSYDEVVVPPETAWFGFYKPFSVDDVESYKEKDLYKEDFIGLKKLESEGRLFFIECKGAHQEFSRGWFYSNILPFLNTTIDVSVLPNTLHNEL